MRYIWAMSSFRNKRTPEQRAASLQPYIDPGFVNHRLVETFIGPSGMALVTQMMAEVPPNTPDWNMSVRLDHAYTRVALEVCRASKTSSLGELVRQPEPQVGQIVSSTEVLEGNPDVYEKERASVRWVPSFEVERAVTIELSTRHIGSDTTRSQLASGRYIHSCIARLSRVEGCKLFLEPLVLGGPWLQAPAEGVPFDFMFLHYRFFEHFVEDMDEFQKITMVPDSGDWDVMRSISEKAFKLCVCQLPSDTPKNDWGGERSDHFTSHLHLRGHRLTAAFLLKGPGIGFRELQPGDLGKNGDQIYRLASEPADMLILQHCHEVSPAVRATLRAFAVQPHDARRYCIIDGRDSFRLLTAYGLLPRAVRESRAGKR